MSELNSADTDQTAQKGDGDADGMTISIDLIRLLRKDRLVRVYTDCHFSHICCMHQHLSTYRIIFIAFHSLKYIKRSLLYNDRKVHNLV